MSVKGKWELKKVYVNTYYCDTCKKKGDTWVASVGFGYGSIYDDDILHFCSDECIGKWAKKFGAKHGK